MRESSYGREQTTDAAACRCCLSCIIVYVVHPLLTSRLLSFVGKPNVTAD